MTRNLRLLMLVQLLTFAVGVGAVIGSALPPSGQRPVATSDLSASDITSAARRAPLVARPATRAVAAKPAVPAKPRVTKKKAPRRVRVTSSRAATTVRAVRPVAKTPVASTARQRLDQAIARIPGYRAGEATWRLEAKDGYWGTADWYTNTIYISPSVPANRIYDVVAHEWSHLLSVRAYDSVDQAMAAMNAYFGGSGITGAERAADCMARRLGAGWTHYTACKDTRWLSGAADLIAGRRL